MKRRWRDFITSGYRVKYQGYEQYTTLSKLKFLNIALILGAVISLAIVVMQLQGGDRNLLFLYGGLAAVFGGLLVLLRKRRYLLPVSHCLLALLLFTLYFAFTNSGIYAYTNLFFLISFPLGSYYLLGKREGSFWVGGYALVYLLLMVLNPVSYTHLRAHET